MMYDYVTFLSAADRGSRQGQRTLTFVTSVDPISHSHTMRVVLTILKTNLKRMMIRIILFYDIL